MTGIAPTLGVLVEVAVGGFVESQLAGGDEPGGGLSGLLLLDRINTVSKQLSGSSSALSSFLQTEVGGAAEPEPTLTAVKLVAQHPALGAALGHL